MIVLSPLLVSLKKWLSFLHFISHIYSFSISSDLCKSVFFLHYLYQKKISFSNTSCRKYLFSFITFEIIYFLSPWPLGETIFLLFSSDFSIFCFLLHVNTLSCVFTFHNYFITYILFVKHESLNMLKFHDSPIHWLLWSLSLFILQCRNLVCFLPPFHFPVSP